MASRMLIVVVTLSGAPALRRLTDRFINHLCYHLFSLLIQPGIDVAAIVGCGYIITALDC